MIPWKIIMQGTRVQKRSRLGRWNERIIFLSPNHEEFFWLGKRGRKSIVLDKLDVSKVTMCSRVVSPHSLRSSAHVHGHGS
jgi:hypothetical protein